MGGKDRKRMSVGDVGARERKRAASQAFAAEETVMAIIESLHIDRDIDSACKTKSAGEQTKQERREGGGADERECRHHRRQCSLLPTRG